MPVHEKVHEPKAKNSSYRKSHITQVRPREDDGEATPRKRGRPKASSLLQRYPTLKLLDDVTI